MLRIRVSGAPSEVEAFADALERTGAVLERSRPYANRGPSRYVRVYMDIEAKGADADEKDRGRYGNDRIGPGD